MDVAVNRRFLVLHGWPNRRPVHHWQWQLVEELRRRGEQVLYPQLPDPDEPVRERWVELLHAELAQLGAGERVVVAHSLSVLLWLHAAADLAPEQRVHRVLLVAPPSRAEVAKLAPVREFADVRADPAAVAAASGVVRVVASDNDPYCPEGARAALGDLLPEVDSDVLAGQGHLDPDAGYGAWPAAVAWCLDPATRLQARS